VRLRIAKSVRRSGQIGRLTGTAGTALFKSGGEQARAEAFAERIEDDRTSALVRHAGLRATWLRDFVEKVASEGLELPATRTSRSTLSSRSARTSRWKKSKTFPLRDAPGEFPPTSVGIARRISVTPFMARDHHDVTWEFCGGVANQIRGVHHAGRAEERLPPI